MESNKEESERWIKLAEQFLQFGEVDQAVKYLRKAQRLHPSQRAKDLLDGIDGSESAFSCFENMEEYTAQAKADDGSSSSLGNSGSKVHETKYSEEQLSAVRKIQMCKDFYEILGLQQGCSDDELKRSYKKLALKFHPDKNHAPGATEAFMAISNAFDTLSNPSKRHDYDKRGCTITKEPSPMRRRPSQRAQFGENAYDFMRDFEGEFSADELFRMFFNEAFQPRKQQMGGFQPTPQKRSAPPRSTQHQQPPPTSRQTTYKPRATPTAPRPFSSSSSKPTSGFFLLQLSPIFFLVVLSLISMLLVGDTAYSLNQDSMFTELRTTQRYGISYFVRPDFTVKYPSDGLDFRRVERQVEDEHVSNLQYHCYHERSYRENLMWRARLHRNEPLYQQAKDLRSPSCEALQALFTVTTPS